MARAPKAPPPANDALQNLQIVYLDPGSLKERAVRAWKYDPTQVTAMADLIREVGFFVPVVIDKGRIIQKGDVSVAAAKVLGIDAVPTVEISHLTEDQLRLFAIADVQIATKGAWDVDVLRSEMAGLNLAGVDLKLTGFSGEDIGALLAEKTDGLTDPDAAGPLPPVPTSVLGDVWLLGRHRLVCGDSTRADVIKAACGGLSPVIMATDPPYGVNYDPLSRSAALNDGAKRASGKVQNDDRADRADRADWSEVWKLFTGNVAYVWHSGLYSGVVYQSLKDAGFNIRAQIVWVKTRFALSRGDYHWQHEAAFYAVKPDAPDNWQFIEEHEAAFYAVKEKGTGNWKGDRKQSTVWNIEHLKNDTGHGTQKPVECMRRPIINNSAAGQAVFEPFSGSGTTIIACEMTGRSACAIELDPAYVDVALERWQAFTGKAATLEGDGRTFAEIKGERHGA